jgi:hypothetical protein
VEFRRVSVAVLPLRASTLVEIVDSSPTSSHLRIGGTAGFGAQ